MTLLRFTSLKQKLLLLLLLPVVLMLAGLGTAGFIHVRANLLEQWRATALFGMARAAHAVDMRLALPRQFLEVFSAQAGLTTWSLEDWQALIEALPGVVKVELDMGEAGAPAMPRGRGGRAGVGRMRWFHRARVSKVSEPRLDPDSGQRRVTLTFDLGDQSGRTVGRLQVVMSFDYLLKGIRDLNWWQSDQVCLVDQEGRILAQGKGGKWSGPRLGSSGDPLELATLQAMRKRASGTLLGPGHPAERVSGFYRLQEAPWTVVTMAPGDKVLAPIAGFMLRYALAGLLCLGLVVLIIMLVAGRMAASVAQVARAAERVARGDYQGLPAPRSRDEMGRLVESFNSMVQGLKERDYIRSTFGRYVDEAVAKKLMSRPEAARLGGEKRWVVVMMTDIRGFTPLCERLSPEQTIAIVNRYLSGLIEVIQAHRGIIVDFLGDSILAFFDTLDQPLAAAALAASCCALELRQATLDFNRQARSEGLEELQTGIGLHAGEVVVGNIGSRTRTKYGIVGGPVNLTHRIQAQAQGGQIIISDSLRQVLAERLQTSRSFRARLKGVEGETTLHILAGVAGCRDES